MLYDAPLHDREIRADLGRRSHADRWIMKWIEEDRGCTEETRAANTSRGPHDVRGAGFKCTKIDKESEKKRT